MKASSKLSELIAAGRTRLTAAHIPSNGADWLMMDLFDLSQLDLLMDVKTLSTEQAEKYERDIEQLSAGMPLAHVTGFQEFYGRRFRVTKDVLVPRPETEELVQRVLALAPGGIVADIGTGSGCIAVTLAAEGQYKEIYAVDISSSALDVARTNAGQYDVDIEFVEGDLLTPLKARDVKVDVLVSNPPYIAQHERVLMNSSVLDYDPPLALFAEDDGLALYKRMIDNLSDVLNDGAFVFFEIGHAQGERLRQYIEAAGVTEVHVEQDINQLDRIIWFQWCE